MSIGKAYVVTCSKEFVFVILADIAVLVFLFRGVTREVMKVRSNNVIWGAIVLLLAVVLAGELLLALTQHKIFLYALPLLPIFTRAAVAIVFYPLLSLRLSPEEQQRVDYRTVVIGLMPISFAGLIALTIYDARVSGETSLAFPGYYMLLSFLAFYLVLNLQSYKEKEWTGQLGAGVMDIATLSMLLAVAAILFYGGQPVSFKRLFIMIAVSVWLIDHAIRLYKEALVLHGKLDDLGG